MKLSFVIPAYNEEHTVGKCLESVLQEIDRNHLTINSDVEVVVVNNVSTDRTKEVALSMPGVRVVDEPHKGLVWARKAGFDNTRGELVANVDADTELPVGWLATVFKEFTHPNVVALSGPYIYTDISFPERTLVKFFYAIGYVFYWLAHYIFGAGAMLQGGNYIVRRTALEQIGGFDTHITFYGEDTDIAKRIGEVGEVRWTWRLPMYTSGRRLRKEGVVRMGLRYAVNFFWVNFFGHPYSTHYIDIRTSATKGEQK